MTLCLFILGSLTYIGDLSPSLAYLAIITLFIFGFSYGAGVGPVAFNVAQEIFPMEARSFGCSLSQAIRYGLVFVDIQQYSIMGNIIGLGGVYFLHAGIMVMGIVFACLYFPETRNKSFTEMEN